MRAFIAMPFATAFNPHWQAIQEVCQNFGIETFRVDQNLSFERHIDIAIRQEIEKSHFMIAILTGDTVETLPNPNVSYEVGYAQGVGKEVILLAQSVECLPFDFKQQRACLYQQDIVQMKVYLERELKLLKEMVQKKQKEQLEGFFKDVYRCLDIVLPPEYRFFKQALGFQEDYIWSGVYLFADKYFVMYTVCVSDDVNNIQICVWLGDETHRNDQKIFAKKYYENIRMTLGYDVVVNFNPQTSSASNVISKTRDKNFASQIIKFPKQTFSTNEALTVALRLRAYIETFQPIFTDFIKEKNLPNLLS